MKLEDWYEQNSAALSKGDLSQKYQDALRDKYVIGTCGDCKYFITHSVQYQGDGMCNKSPSMLTLIHDDDSEVDNAVFNVEAEYGCLQWEKKYD